MSITLRALKKPLLIAAASVLAAVIGGCALLLAAPAMIINPLAKNIALSQGIVLQKLVIDAPVRAKRHKGRRVFTLSIETASSVYEGDSFEIIDTEIAFGLRDLVAGRLDSIAIAESKIRAPAKASETESCYNRLYPRSSRRYFYCNSSCYHFQSIHCRLSRCC